ncbi:NAD(P)H-binding protein [Kineosporia rhizophila]|uniref:NAD(P)-dependent oxidoreductase n=1 Tax=Kineosporia TaxID=49184 RepID=UPI001E616692|nr:NAD(P)H-binding protein [Kineosporia sp. NBRC 101677]MCE0538680.1 NAD(P)H-binding protein [Kineosporia rhizophila]GLY19458.1 NAD-dependent epimerase [Kineosporia sp. NBRC 101677]
MSKVVIFGVTGYAGGKIAAELVSRGHEVVGVARHAKEVGAGVELLTGSIHDEAFVADVTKGADQIVVALRALPGEEGQPELAAALPLLTKVSLDQGARLSFVGGAGSLFVTEGGPALIDTPEFPDAYKGEAGSHRAILEALRESPAELDWFYVSPAPAFGSWNPGERTGTFRKGGDVLLEGAETISGDDYAIAYVDEIEAGAHRRQRIGVAY